MGDGREHGFQTTTVTTSMADDCLENKMSMLIIVGVPALAPLFFDALCLSLYWTSNKVEA